jgi:diacylglycerol kinase (ATP)
MRPTRMPPTVKRVSESPFLRSFHFAFEGILYATKTQRNMRIHLAITALVLLATLYLRLQRVYVVLLVVLIGFVLALELINTAIEAIVDLMTVAHHPLAKVAKDAAAGAVLIGSITAVIVGYLTYYEHITAIGSRVYEQVAAVPANLVLVGLGVVAILTIFAKAYFGYGTVLQGGAVSGHAALAFAAATMLSLVAPHPLTTCLAYFLAFLVSQSRVEGGIHSTFEVVFGALLGSGVSLLLFLLWHSPRVL